MGKTYKRRGTQNHIDKYTALLERFTWQSGRGAGNCICFDECMLSYESDGKGGDALGPRALTPWERSGHMAQVRQSCRDARGGPNSQSHPGFLRVSSVQAALHFPASTPARLSASGFRPSGHTGITSPPIPGPSGPWLLNETSHALPRKTRAVLIQQDFTRRRALTTWNIYPKRP